MLIFMKNLFEKKLDNGDESKTDVEKSALFNAEEFFDEHGKAIEDYAQDRGIIFRRGNQWAIEMEKGLATYDAKHFADKNFSKPEAMLVSCHEIEHFRDWRRDPEAFRSLFSRMISRRRLKLLYNCLDDIQAYQTVDKRFPSLKEVRENRYRQKLFPATDYTKDPRHLQFAYAILREKMLPEGIVNLAPEVREAIDDLKNIDGEGTDLIKLVSDPDAKPADRYEIIRDYIEPIYEKFFQEDVKEKKEQESQEGKKDEGGKGEPEPGKNGKSKKPQSAEDYFSDDYDDFDGKFSEPMSPQDIKDTLDKFIKDKKAKKEKTPEEIAREQFEKEHGVSSQEIENYRADYEKIKQYVESLREIFERIISKRKEIKRRLKERTEQGVVLDPSLISQAYIDAQSGILDSRTQLKIRKEEYDENKPNNFEFTLICDLSGSMDDEKPGGKSFEQRLCSVLIMEAFDEFEEKLKAERLEKSLDLRVLTEIRGFGDEDEELKPMSDFLDYKTRVAVASRLAKCNAGSTRDFDSLAKIDKGINEDIRRKIEKNDLKKIVLLITDGGSDDIRQAKKEKEALAKAGVITKAIQIGEVSQTDKEKFKEVWQKPKKDGYSCKNVSELVPTVEKLLEEFLSDL